MNESIVSFLIRHKRERAISFHMPGHKGGDIIRRCGYSEFLDDVLGCDITEIEGADNLFQPEGIIKETMEGYKKLYGVKQTNLLVNGSSSGLVAGILSAVARGEKLIMARNSHKSVFNAVKLGGIKPVYAWPKMIDEYKILGEVTPEEIKRLIEENPEAKAVILPSPNYYGICSDIKAIAQAVHEAGMILIVDQAHGAHLKFYDESMAAENLGADLVINSTHKTLLSLTESAIINICSDLIDIDELEDKIQSVETSSPSYILMASLDINQKILRDYGEELIKNWKRDIASFKSKCLNISGLKILEHQRLDETKINLDMSELGLSGAELEKLLIGEGIYPELVTGNIVMCMTGIGNKKEDYDRLYDALINIADSRESKEVKDIDTVNAVRLNLKEVPVLKEKIYLSKSEGRIIADSITPYPPGIPIACPGEVINADVINYLTELRNSGVKVTGIDDEGKISVGI